MNCTWYDTKADIELVKDKFKAACERMPKLRYKLVEFAGDFYYEEMTTEETFSKCFYYNNDNMLKTQRDIDYYV